MTNAKSRQRITAVAIIAIIALLGINAMLLYYKYKQDKVIYDQKMLLSEKNTMHAELEKEFYEALSELEEMRGTNELLDQTIDQQKEELKNHRDKISGLIKENKSLFSARAELQKMRTKIDSYIAEIGRLEHENRILMDTTSLLREDRMLLTQKIASERQNNDELLSIKAALTESNESLAVTNTNLSSKVNIASVINTQNIQIEGFKYGTAGQERQRKKAKNIEVLKICFDAQSNKVVDPGNELFYVRIVDPAGQTLALESHGSGVLYNDMTKEQVRYTKMTEVEYDQNTQTICMAWEPGLPFAEGKYAVEVYNKGFKCGSGEFEMN